MNEQQQKRVMERLSEDLVPGDVNLWPTVRTRLESSNQKWQKGEFTMNAKRARLAITLLSMIVILGILMVSLPKGRALAQEIFRFFTRAESDTLPVQEFQIAPPVQSNAPDPASILDADQSIIVREADQELFLLVDEQKIDVLEPGWLPDTLVIIGASVEQENQIVRIFYQLDESNGLVLRQETYEISSQCELCGMVGASAAIEEVSIGDNSGEYVVGVWKLSDNGPVWEPDTYMQTLRWQVDGMALELMFMGDPEAMTREEMVQIAESVR
jgi:hypothetical protein